MGGTRYRGITEGSSDHACTVCLPRGLDRPPAQPHHDGGAGGRRGDQPVAAGHRPVVRQAGGQHADLLAGPGPAVHLPVHGDQREPAVQAERARPPPAQRASIYHDLTSLRSQGVEAVYYESQSQAFARFKQDFAQDRSFSSLVTQNEIPDSFQVKLRNAQTDYPVVAGAVEGRQGVDNIVNVESILSNFYKLLDGARNAVIVVAIILVIAAILLVANTIRLSAFNRRRETSIMRLVGASNFYVQLPFLLEGIIAGMFGWLIAAGLLIAVKTLGLDTLQQYFPYNVRLSLADLIEVIVLAMVMGVVLCGVTSFLTLRRYLRA